jgi:hypothetical protein
MALEQAKLRALKLQRATQRAAGPVADART